MSIVSRNIDTFSVPRPVKNGNPVGWKPGAPQYDIYSQPRQKPNFNVSKNIRKPLRDVDYIHGKVGVVPLKCEQWGHDIPKLFAPMNTDLQVLKVPVPQPTNMGLGQSEEYTPQFQLPFPYNDGIRPSIRPLRETDILEPTGPVFRPRKARIGHYRPQPYPTEYLPDDEIVHQVRNL